MTVKRYIGLDISASETGVTILDRAPDGRLSLVWVGHIKTVASQGTGAKKITFTDGERLKIIRSSLYEILDKFNPQVFVKEGQGADMNKFRSVSLVSKATGVIEECCQSWWGKDPLEIHAYPPSTIKKEVTGFGGVDKTIKGSDTWSKYLRKKPVIDEVVKLFGGENYSHVNKKLKGVDRVMYNDNETDSTAVIITHFKKEGIDVKC
ncbi:crossover junction endodeoxyribonuclease RuvC [Bacillus paranthracis]|uniref:crossover junction endodeoxyribonuclease RuvC n=1 Tax=Bacillus paranthracis TaxID=2026186 RepID=UPI002E1A2F25|nr:crossover junction endodeoxyribonuclease RuvC [Bacillus paranthracis]